VTLAEIIESLHGPICQGELDRVSRLAGVILQARVAAGSDVTMEQVAIDAVELHKQITKHYAHALFPTEVPL
jgi:hypothetical protein